MICHDTIEEKILQLQKMKSDLFEGVIEADSSFSKQLSAEDITLLSASNYGYEYFWRS